MSEHTESKPTTLTEETLDRARADYVRRERDYELLQCATALFAAHTFKYEDENGVFTNMLPDDDPTVYRRCVDVAIELLREIQKRNLPL
jgi:hypothetical protein